MPDRRCLQFDEELGRGAGQSGQWVGVIEVCDSVLCILCEVIIIVHGRTTHHNHAQSTAHSILIIYHTQNGNTHTHTHTHTQREPSPPPSPPCYGADTAPRVNTRPAARCRRGHSPPRTCHLHIFSVGTSSGSGLTLVCQCTYLLAMRGPCWTQ